MKENIYLFDTTLRDGSQTQGVDFSIDDKNKIALALSNLGLDYIEGGWPGANPLDTSFFNTPPKMNHSKLVAFGMTKKTGRRPLNQRSPQQGAEKRSPSNALGPAESCQQAQGSQCGPA